MFTGLIIGAIVIICRPHLPRASRDRSAGPAIVAAIGSVGNAYGALVGGAFGIRGQYVSAIQSGDSAAMTRRVRPLTESLIASTP